MRKTAVVLLLLSLSGARAGAQDDRGTLAEVMQLLYGGIAHGASQEDLEVEGILTMLAEGGESAGYRTGSSIGLPHDGSLLGAVPLPPHPGYSVLSADRAYGAPSAVTWFVQAFAELKALDPTAPAVMVHDLSHKGGGPMAGHKSHQSGRDADVAYYRKSCDDLCRLAQLAPAELDAGRQWRLLHHWLSRGQVQFVFIDYELQKPLYEEAQRAGTSEIELVRWFQFPGGTTHRSGIIRHVDNHKDHMHVRFRCAVGDARCRSTRLLSSDVGSEQPGYHEAVLLQQLHDERQMLELLGER